MPNTLSPTPQNPSYNNSVNVPQPGYTLAGLNGMSSSDLVGTISLTPLASAPTVSMSFDGALDIKLMFNSSENAQNIRMEFAPDPTIGVNELMKVMMLAQLAMSGGVRFQADVMSYVRKNNLERHFKFTVV